MLTKITNTEAKRLLTDKPIILTTCDNIELLPDTTNHIYYNAGAYGWNYSIVWSYAHDAYIISAYRLPNSVLKVAKSVVKVNACR